MSQPQRTVPSLPNLGRWHRWLLAGLFALYVAELIAWNTSLPLDRLIWWPFGQGFALWQPLTHYLIQGRSVLNVMVGLFVLYFMLPAVESALGTRRLGQCLASGALGGLAMGAALAAIGVAIGPSLGWTALASGLIIAFGLARPDAQIMLFFVVPVSGTVIVWGSLVVELLFLLANRSIGSAEAIGVWLGIFAWWNLTGPNARKRRLLQRGKKIEKELQRFQVIDGGRSGQQGPQRNDDWINAA